MEYEYLKNDKIKSFTFLKVPKKLLTDYKFKELSIEAIILYSILLERTSLSQKYNWIDDKGRIYIICTLEEIAKTFKCSVPKAIKLLDELDVKKGAGLIRRKRQGLCKANLIYVKNFNVLQNGKDYTSEM